MDETNCAECKLKFSAGEQRRHGVDGKVRHADCHREAHARRSVVHGGQNYVARRGA